MLVVAFAILFTRPTAAFDIAEAEHTALKACERQLCEIVLARRSTDFSCLLQKTWARAQLQENVERKRLSWTVGDARCRSNLVLAHDDIVHALSEPKWIVQFAPHVVHCDIETEKKTSSVDVTLAPKIVFRKGYAEKAWINVRKIDAPSGWKAALWTVAKVEDGIGIFHRDLLKQIDKLMRERCPAEYGAAADVKSQSSGAQSAGSKP